MRPEDTTAVRNLDLFAAMDDSRFDKLMHAAFLQRFPPRVQLISEGDSADFLYIVVEGCVEMFATHNDRETTLTLVMPVSAFILAAVLTDTPFLMSARTTCQSRILMIPSEEIRSVFSADAKFARAIVRQTSWAYRTLVKTLKEQKLRFGTERLAAYLLRLHTVQQHQDVVTLPVEKRTVAALLGMTSENLSRAFATLGRHGVEVSGATIRLTDIDALKAIAKPVPSIDDPDY